MRPVHIKFTRDMPPSKGGYREGQRLVFRAGKPAERAAEIVAAGDAIYVDSAFYPAPQPPFPGLPPPIPEPPRKRILTHKG